MGLQQTEVFASVFAVTEANIQAEAQSARARRNAAAPATRSLPRTSLGPERDPKLFCTRQAQFALRGWALDRTEAGFRASRLNMVSTFSSMRAVEAFGVTMGML